MRAPRWTAIRCAATDAATRSEGVSRPVSSPRLRLRDRPASTGTPSSRKRSERASRVMLWAVVLPKPKPRSISRFFFAMPAISAANRRCTRKPCTSATTSWYCGSACMRPGSPCMCINTTGTPASAAASSAPSWRRAKMSLIMPAPAATAARITSGLKVSMLIGTRVRSQLLDHRNHPTQLFLDRDRRGARAGGFAADIKQVRTLLDQLQAMRDRGLGGVVRATIGERIGVTLTMPMTRARSRRRMRPAQSSWGEVSNMGNPAGATRRSLSRGPDPRMRAVVPAPIAAWPQALRRARPGSDIRWDVRATEAGTDIRG